ncbi:HNH endonuclease signature motif containing protein [Pseudescherichia sp.]|uniref:HNH endonuclease signature motif containing protein n=1 Tax=Pseudescherichia sp. TaxID=2055881 RepID=UPI0028A0D062|nr:HNH endonuclease signature motif containing protein [Pseudescherichia sp.]
MNGNIQWKLIPSSQHYYISENGDVFNTKLNHYIGTKNPKSGYKKISINGESLYVHVLVCTLFKGPKPSGGRYTVDHIDRDKMNNKAKNLRWVTQKVNNSNRKHKGTCTKNLTLKQWLLIVGEYLKGQLSQYAITKWFSKLTGINIAPQNIGKLFKGETYTKWYVSYLSAKQKQLIKILTKQRKP